MKKTILFLSGMLSVLFFVSCSKEQVVLTIPPKPVGGGPGSIVQNPIAAHTGLNGSVAIPPQNPPPKVKGSAIRQIGRLSSTGLSGSLATTPTKPKPTGPSGFVKTAQDSHTSVNGESNVSPTPPPKP